MESVAITWLVASAISPLVTVLALWTIYVFHTYRRRWRTVDLFLLTLTSAELLSSVLTFCSSILHLVHRGPFRIPCALVRWGQVSSRTFQVATLASMVVDRALTVRWPYRYRFSVRRNQIRYHIAVLALVSALVGVAAVFASVEDTHLGEGQSSRLEDIHPREATGDVFTGVEDVSPLSAATGDVPEKKSKSTGLPDFDEGRCHLHPAQWDVRYAVFLLSLYGALFALWLFCTVQVEIHRGRPHVKLATGGPPECVSPDLPTGGMNSPLDTQSSTGSTRALHRPSRQASRRPYGRDNKSTSDLRWPSVAFVSLLCFTLNHVPYLVLTGLAAWHPRLWSPWHEPGLAWLGLLEGMIVPLLLFCRDAPLRAALRRAFQRRSGALSPLVGDDGPFQMYFDKDHFRKRGTFGSVTPIGIITNYRRTPGSGQKRRGAGKGGSGAKYTLPGLHGADSVLPKSFLGSNAEPLSKLSCADLTSLGMWREEEEEYYATLSDDFSTFSCKSGDDSALSEDLRLGEEEEVYGGSFTTVANDDFEFHDTRPCGGEVKMRPALLSPDTPLPPPSRNTSFRENIRPKVSIPKVFQEPRQSLFVNLEDEELKDPDLFILPPANEWNDEDKDPNSSTSPEDTPPRHPPPRKPTSLSMNDLDLIHKKGHPVDDLEATFILPVKSESTMSLYRLNVDQDSDPAMTPSRSETNVNNNGDSGFGSGAQSTNPVWSGFLCRKPSDPFWNMRKPSTAAVAVTTPTRNSGNYPGILHPRMRKIPWISAWRKLDENSRQQQQQQSPVANVDDSQELEDGDILGWKENLVYEANGALATMNPCEVAIDEELSDVGTPLATYPGEYDLNVFAKESGILMENAYGKIVRDDCGVQVNFYSKNVQYDNTIGRNDPTSCFERSVEPCRLSRELFEFGHQNGDYSNRRQPLEGLCDDGVNPPKDVANQTFPAESLFCESATVANEFKCEPRLNGGHYENLFGTKENIFAQCDSYVGRENFKSALPESHFEKRIGREGSFPYSNGNATNGDSVYGQLNKPEQQYGNFRNVGKSPSKAKELRRRESDNRGNRCGIKRRESRTRSDPRPNLILETTARTSLAGLGKKSDATDKFGNGKKSVEIEMKNVNIRREPSHESRLPRLENNANQNHNSHDNEQKRSKPESSCIQKPSGGHFSQAANSSAKVERRDSRSRDKDPSRERKHGVERKLSGRRAPTELKDSVAQSDPTSHNQSNVPRSERRVSQLGHRKESGLPVRVERRNSDRIEKQLPSHHRRDDPKGAGVGSRAAAEIRNEGLWVNALPFQSSRGSKDEENGNSPRRGSARKEKQVIRSPRKSNLPRRESDGNKNDRARVRRKVSANRGRERLEDPEGKVWNKDNTNPGHGTTSTEGEAGVDDLCKFRDRLEDNFSHIQNLNRGCERLDRIVLGGKLNGNIPDSRQQNGEMYPFETFQENGLYATPCDDNENCRERKLAITDFL